MVPHWPIWLVVLMINVDLAFFQPYLDLEVGDNQSLKIQVAKPGIEPRSSCSASQELNHSATAAPLTHIIQYWNHGTKLTLSRLGPGSAPWQVYDRCACVGEGTISSTLYLVTPVSAALASNNNRTRWNGRRSRFYIHQWRHAEIPSWM